MQLVLPLSFSTPTFKTKTLLRTNHVLTGLRIRRAGTTIFYHRTAKGLNDLFHPSTGDLRTFFLVQLNLFNFQKAKKFWMLAAAEKSLRKIRSSRLIFSSREMPISCPSAHIPSLASYPLGVRFIQVAVCCETHTLRFKKNNRPQRKVPYEKINCYC